MTWAARVARVDISFPEEFPVDDYTAWRPINHSMALIDEIYPEGTGKYGKRFTMIFVARDGPTLVHLTRGCQVLTERERRYMLGILIDRGDWSTAWICVVNVAGGWTPGRTG